MLTGIQHVNLSIGVEGTSEQNAHTLKLATDFYHGVLGLGEDPVPAGREGNLKWFRVGNGVQQIHCSFEPASSRLGASESEGHVCFTIPRALLPDLQAKLLEFSKSGNEAACSAPYRGTQAQEMGMETMDRFFLRDFAGNRLEIGAED